MRLQEENFLKCLVALFSFLAHFPMKIRERMRNLVLYNFTVELNLAIDLHVVGNWCATYTYSVFRFHLSIKSKFGLCVYRVSADGRSFDSPLRVLFISSFFFSSSLLVLLSLLLFFLLRFV